MNTDIVEGGKIICGCGRELTPVYNDKCERIGVSHKDADDEDWHNQYFSGMRATISKPN